MPVNVIYFVHGTTTDNELKHASGWNEALLSDKGKVQAEELRNKIDLNQIDVVFCSDLKRAVESANIIFKNDKNIIIDNRLRECNYGKLNGKDSSKVIYENHIFEKFPDGESLLDVEDRIRYFCNFLINEYDNKNVAIVAHKAPQLALEVITKNVTWENAIENDWRKTKNWQPRMEI